MEIDTNKTPKQLSMFMMALMKEARRHSLIDLLENWGISYDDFVEIEEWFLQFGIDL